MGIPPKEYDDTVIYVPEEVIRDIDRALDYMEKARQELIRAIEERKASETAKQDDKKTDR